MDTSPSSSPADVSSPGVRHVFVSPFGAKYPNVYLSVPDSMTAGKIKEVPKLAEELIVVLTDNKVDKVPVTMAGLTALRLIAKTMPGELANGPDGMRLIGWVGMVAFLRQVLQIVGKNAKIKRGDYETTLVQYAETYGPDFVEALKVRLPILVSAVQQADQSSAVRVKRLQSLASLTDDILEDLEDIWGADKYEEWKQMADFDKEEEEEEEKEQQDEEEVVSASTPPQQDQKEQQQQQKEKKKKAPLLKSIGSAAPVQPSPQKPEKPLSEEKEEEVSPPAEEKEEETEKSAPEDNYGGGGDEAEAEAEEEEEEEGVYDVEEEEEGDDNGPELEDEGEGAPSDEEEEVEEDAEEKKKKKASPPKKGKKAPTRK